MKQCNRIAEIQEDFRKLANVETGEQETPLGKKRDPTWRKSQKVGDKVNFVGEFVFIRM